MDLSDHYKKFLRFVSGNDGEVVGFFIFPKSGEEQERWNKSVRTF